MPGERVEVVVIKEFVVAVVSEVTVVDDEQTNPVTQAPLLESNNVDPTQV
jgi:hypothetical protein